MMQDMESARFIGGVSPMPLGWAEVVHCIDPRNARSQALARRLGSTILRQGRMPPPLDQEIIDVWGQSREQWRARRGVTQSSKSSQTG